MLGRVEVGARQEDHLGRGACISDGGNSLLARRGPERDVEIMRLVGEAEDDLRGASVLGRQLRPETGKLGVGRPCRRLPDDVSVEACECLQVEDAVGGSGQAGLHERVIVFYVCAGQSVCADVVVDQILPGHGYTFC